MTLNQTYNQQQLKSAIKPIFTNSRLKENAIDKLVDLLTNYQINPQDWENCFINEGAESAIRMSVYAPAMARLLTLRAIILPHTLPEFLFYITRQTSANITNNCQEESLNFQKNLNELIELKKLLKLSLLEGIEIVLVKLMNREVEFSSVVFLLTESNIWVSQLNEYLLNNYEMFELIRQNQGKNVNYKIWQKSYLWQPLVKYYQSLGKTNKIEVFYQPFVNLLMTIGYQQIVNQITAPLISFRLAVYFSQISGGYVPQDLFEVAFPCNCLKNREFLGLKLNVEPRNLNFSGLVNFLNNIQLKVTTKVNNYNNKNTGQKQNNNLRKMIISCSVFMASGIFVSFVFTFIDFFATRNPIIKLSKEQREEALKEVNLKQSKDKLEALKKNIKNIENGEETLINILCGTKPNCLEEKNEQKFVENVFSYEKRKQQFTEDVNYKPDGIIDEKTITWLKKDIFNQLRAENNGRLFSSEADEMVKEGNWEKTTDSLQ
jgi:hypothetical protein